MTFLEQLIAVCDEYAKARGIGRQRVSTIVLNRGATLDRIAEGKSDVSTGTFEKAMLWLSMNWPAGAVWPAGVPRPSEEKEAA